MSGLSGGKWGSNIGQTKCFVQCDLLSHIVAIFFTDALKFLATNLRRGNFSSGQALSDEESGSETYWAVDSVSH